MAAGLNLEASKIRFAAAANDATGFTETIAAAGTPQAVADALLVQRVNNSVGGLVWDVDDGTLTVSKQQAAGVYDLTALAADVIGSNGGVCILQFQRAPAATPTVFAAVGNPSRATMASTAVRLGMAPVAAAGVSLALGDVVRLVADVGTNGHVVILRALEIRAEKV